MHRILALALLILAGGLLLSACSSSSGQDQDYNRLTWPQLEEKIDSGQKFVLVDLREPQLYQAGHIKGAINIPFDQFNNRTGELNRDQDIVFVCHTGGMGDTASKTLVEKGYKKVANLTRGMAGWKGEVVK